MCFVIILVYISFFILVSFVVWAIFLQAKFHDFLLYYGHESSFAEAFCCCYCSNFVKGVDAQITLKREAFYCELWIVQCNAKGT